MGPVITVATSKGGSGKTTLVMALASMLAERGRDFTLVDADRNATLGCWVQHYYRGPEVRWVADIDHNTIAQTIRSTADQGLVIVDTAGFENQTAAYAMGCADLVLVPCMADRGSTAEAARTAKNLKAVSAVTGRSTLMRVVLSRWSPRGLAERAALEDLFVDGLVTLDTAVPNLTDFAKLSFGGSLGERSAALVTDLLSELNALLPKPKRKRAAA